MMRNITFSDLCEVLLEDHAMRAALYLRNLFFLLLIMALSACADSNKLFSVLGSKVEQPECPPIRLLKDAEKVTNFASTSSIDISDIMFEAVLMGFSGTCHYSYNKKIITKVNIKLSLDIKASLGPAANSRNILLKYFVAIPSFFPDPKGKSIFSKKVLFPRNQNTISFTTRPIKISIPINKKIKIIEMLTLVGFDLSGKQLEFNRRYGTRPLLTR
ncbi:MAG: hypothetical protein VX617_06860 [Pseudomonadota bacterium]|nr:hypothetical protein [Pseudomonadota bacterium]